LDKVIAEKEQEIDILEKDLAKKDKLEKIIDFWRGASVLTKVRKDLQNEAAEKAKKQSDEALKSKSELKEHQPSKLQNFL
jgi:hypothetical protein